MFRTVHAAAAAVLLVSALSGCSLIGATSQTPPSSTASSTPTPTEAAQGDQTARDACIELLPALADTNDRMTDAFAVLQQSGPEQMAPLLHGISDDFHAALDGVSNDEVLEVSNAFADSLNALTAEFDAVVAGDGDPDALNAASKAVIDDFAAIGDVCRAAG